MILDLDIGNTRVKWRLSDDAGHVSSGHRVHGLDEIHFRDAEFAGVRRVRVSSVASSEQVRAIAGKISEALNVQPEFALTQQECCGVRNSYQDCSRMGVDRWLAMLAGYRLANGACCVIDAGTAVTLYCVDTAGQHLGGYIVPGYATMRGSLLSGTGQIRIDGDVRPAEHPGRSTESAVCNGALLMLVGFIERALGQFPGARGDVSPMVVLTGGDAGMLAEHLDRDFSIQPDLVLDGLALALP